MSTEAGPPRTAGFALRRWRWWLALVGVLAVLGWLALDFFWLNTMSTLNVGDSAPNFTAQAHNGKMISLSDYRGKQTVVLYFYPRDNTTVCTAQACSFRDSYEDFAKDGAVVIGVSGDSLERHRAFAQKQQLPFLLVSDGDGGIRKAFGVPNRLGLIPRRVTFVIDREGTIRHVFEATFAANPHVENARKVVRELAAAQGG